VVADLQEVLKEDDTSALLSCTIQAEPYPQVAHAGHSHKY
jgi:hypothetical protein